ncbi:hypothetical protein V8C35DRAFT_161014 [Trichoderma chlorosporum]
MQQLVPARIPSSPASDPDRLWRLPRLSIGLPFPPHACCPPASFCLFRGEKNRAREKSPIVSKPHFMPFPLSSLISLFYRLPRSSSLIKGCSVGGLRDGEFFFSRVTIERSTLIPVPFSADNPPYLHCGPKCLPRHFALVVSPPPSTRLKLAPSSDLLVISGGVCCRKKNATRLASPRVRQSTMPLMACWQVVGDVILGIRLAKTLGRHKATSAYLRPIRTSNGLCVLPGLFAQPCFLSRFTLLIKLRRPPAPCLDAAHSKYGRWIAAWEMRATSQMVVLRCVDE